nr:hypothetical protein BaRGS_012301 [Batillaria attramentaria]
MKEMFEKESIRMINNKGEKHGTITARINDKENFEVTTLRIDVVTDGRHAEVEFTKDWQLDANRRDLTINAMFLDVSGERIWMELSKIVCGRFNGPIMATMLKLGMGPYMGLSETCNVEEFQLVCGRAEGLSPLPITFMTGLLTSEDEVYTLNKRLKMSNEETKTALFIIKHCQDTIISPPLRYCMDLHNDTVAKEPKVKDRITELLKYRGEVKLLEEFRNWTPQRFPITGHDLFSKNVPKGPVFAKTLNELRQLWKESNYSMSKEELLDRIEEVAKKVS